MSTTAPDHELFDGSAYTVPFPKADGHDVTDLNLRGGLNLKYNRNDPEHAALIEAQTLGRLGRAFVTYSVEGKMQTIRHDAEDNEIVTHTVAIKIHSFETEA